MADTQTLLTLPALSKRWDGYSIWSIRRRIKEGDLKAVYIGARIFVPLAEALRAEQYGLGSKRSAK
jgi:hypothetical protein